MSPLTDVELERLVEVLRVEDDAQEGAEQEHADRDVDGRVRPRRAPGRRTRARGSRAPTNGRISRSSLRSIGRLTELDGVERREPQHRQERREPTEAAASSGASRRRGRASGRHSSVSEACGRWTIGSSAVISLPQGEKTEQYAEPQMPNATTRTSVTATITGGVGDPTAPPRRSCRAAVKLRQLSPRRTPCSAASDQRDSHEVR